MAAFTSASRVLAAHQLNRPDRQLQAAHAVHCAQASRRLRNVSCRSEAPLGDSERQQQQPQQQKRKQWKPASRRAKSSPASPRVDDGGAQNNASNREFARRDKLQRQRRSHIQIEPVRFSDPMPADPHVAIIGGGISGLMCAIRLAEQGIRSTVFDTVLTVSHLERTGNVEPA